MLVLFLISFPSNFSWSSNGERYFIYKYPTVTLISANRRTGEHVSQSVVRTHVTSCNPFGRPQSRVRLKNYGNVFLLWEFSKGHSRFSSRQRLNASLVCWCFNSLFHNVRRGRQPECLAVLPYCRTRYDLCCVDSIGVSRLAINYVRNRYTHTHLSMRVCTDEDFANE